MFRWLADLFNPKKKTRSPKDCVVKLEDVNPERLYAFKGPNGRFFACTSGRLGPEEPDIFFYGDEHIQLFFAAQETSVGISIESLSSRRDFAARESYPPKDVLRFKQNIQWMFTRWNFRFLDLRRPSTLPPVNIVFGKSCF